MAGLLNKGLELFRGRLSSSLSKQEKREILAELERVLLLSDSGTGAAAAVVALADKHSQKAASLAEVGAAVQRAMAEMLARLDAKPVRWSTAPHVVLMVGVNGGGKTTTVAKLAHSAASANKKVVLAAADTFRAAAASQLRTLAGRLGDNVRMVEGDTDPGAVAYSAVAAGVAAKADLVIIDTAGRQVSSAALMAEITKINKAVGKAMEGAPHETILVLDANTGQSALRQIEVFNESLSLTGCVLTKLDGSARGGVILALAATTALPVHYVGVGEGVDDLLPFSSVEYANALFEGG